MSIYNILATDLVPEQLIRFGIRRMLAQKLREEASPSPEEEKRKLLAFVDELKQLPIAIETDAANKQHYEVPTDFYKLCLGPRLKYSCALWQKDTRNLEEAEINMLDLYVERAGITNGQSILELGCGWGSLSLYLAERFPGANITGVSNSATQKQFIDARAKELGLTNLKIITANIVQFDTPERFDRIVSIEMFEHMKNYELLLSKVRRWLKDDGQLFIHIFTHKKYAYHYENKDGNDWLTEYFFTGGTMPSDDLLSYFNKDMKIAQQWEVNGKHYALTSEAWLKNMYKNSAEVKRLFKRVYGEKEHVKWYAWWKLFFLACAELWGYADGKEWIVSHYLMVPTSTTLAAAGQSRVSASTK